jgi:hypothetical protein
MAAIGACLSALVLSIGVGTAMANASGGDVYNCQFNGSIDSLFREFPNPLVPSNSATVTGYYHLDATATCVFTDANDGTSSTFQAQIASGGRYLEWECEMVQFTGDSDAAGSTLITGGPEGTIEGVGTEIYDIELYGGTGVIDIFMRFRELDGDVFRASNPAGTVTATPSMLNSGGCLNRPLYAPFPISGSFTATT